MLSQVEPTQEGLGWAHQLACSSPVLYRHCSCSPHATQSSPLTQSWVHAEPNHWYRGWCKCYTAQADLSMWAAQQHTPACPGHISCTTSPSNEMWALLSPCRPDNIKQDTNKANRKKGQKLWPASPCHPLFSCDSRHNPALNRQALLETCANWTYWSSSFGPAALEYKIIMTRKDNRDCQISSLNQGNFFTIHESFLLFANVWLLFDLSVICCYLKNQLFALYFTVIWWLFQYLKTNYLWSYFWH